MGYLFKKHYTRDEARELLPQVREWFKQLSRARGRLDQLDQRLAGLLSGGNDVGGPPVNQWVKALAELKQVLGEFRRREIQIKDFDRGLIELSNASAEGIRGTRSASRLLTATRTTTAMPAPGRFC